MARRIGYLTFLLVATLLCAELVAPWIMPRWAGVPASRAALRSEILVPETASRAASETASLEAAPDKEWLGWLSEHVLHPYFGFVRDHEIEAHTFTRQKVAVPVNPDGFFGEPSPPRGSDRYVVLLMGGSVAASLYLDQHQEIQSSLSEALGREVLLVSVAMGGFKQPQPLVALSYFLAVGRQINMVIELDGFNEVALTTAENLRVGISPWFPRAWQHYAAKKVDPENLVRVGRAAFLRRQMLTRQQRWASSKLRHSYLALTAWRAWSLRQEAELARLQSSIDTASGLQLGFQERGPEYRGTDVYGDIVDVWQESSQQMANICRANGIGYMHFLQPNQYVPASKKMSAVERRIAIAGEGNPFRQAVEQGYPRLSTAGREMLADGLAFSDLTGMFRDEQRQVYRDTCCHLNELGNELLAREIVSAVSETVKAPETVTAKDLS